jgi:cation diffusion facilitator family transporter
LPQIPTIPPGTAENRRVRITTARFSLGSAVSLCLVKLVTGILSGSLGVLASAMDNVADIFMSAVNMVSIAKASDPADETHPFGHGKVETAATLFQGGVIALTGVGVGVEAVRRLIKGVAPAGLGLDAGIFVMVFSVAASWFVSSRIRKAGEATGSSALMADSLHFRTDLYSGSGILFSLLLFRLTGWRWLDPGIALAVGAYITAAALPLLAGAARDLVDTGLPPETVQAIGAVIDRHRPMVRGWHALRTRRSGSEIHVDFHVEVCREATLEDAHRVADHLEHEINKLLGNACVGTHVDPCEMECPGSQECARMRKMVREFTGQGRDGLERRKS